MRASPSKAEDLLENEELAKQLEGTLREENDNSK